MTAKKKMLPGMERFAAPPSPVKVIEGFLPAADRLPLFLAILQGPWDILKTRWGANAKRKTVTYYEGDERAANAYMNKFGDKGIHAIPYTQAPPELNAVREMLKQKYGLGLSVCYINYYADGTVQIGWHQDREERGSKSPLLMVTLGGTRTFSIWKIKEGEQPKAEWQEETKSGDLVEMPVGFHDDYKHAVLPQKQFAAARISLTFRCPDLSANGPWGINCKSTAPQTLQPQVWDCHAGKKYPADAIYVGCRVRNRKGGVIREGTPFGNGANPLISHKGAILPTDDSSAEAKRAGDEFRHYAEQKMLDPEFRKSVEELRGKHLLCWCVQDGPKRAKFCHARVWLELANK